jgi:hypothetical protein
VVDEPVGERLLDSPLLFGGQDLLPCPRAAAVYVVVVQERVGMKPQRPVDGPTVSVAAPLAMRFLCFSMP